MTDLKGIFVVQFVNNDYETVHVDRAIFDDSGRLLFLESDEGVIYNWFNIISIRPKK